MNADDIFDFLKLKILETFPEFSSRKITREASLKELGANSIDRAEIIMVTMSSLKLKVPLIEFAQAKNIGELSDVFQRHLLLRDSTLH